MVVDRAQDDRDEFTFKTKVAVTRP